MSTAEALMGHGLPAQLAEDLGATPSAIGAGVGTAQTGAKQFLSKNSEITPTAGNTAYLVQNTLMNPVYLYNSAATAVTGLVFVPSGHTLNGSLNASLSVAQNKAAIMWQYKAKFWASVLTA